ncbi:MAG: Crp/Fnr family transcriptional regulator [Hyphomicrobiaceae bacterium]|nr:Crp/Fnr family transcriptional regulator [Hyphomicrobiaceae bacterium]
MDKTEWDLIKSAPLFDGVPDEAVRRLIGNRGAKEYDKGAILFQQGMPADAFYFILDGWVKIYRISPHGSETIVGIFTRGQSFAEAAIFDGAQYPVFAEVIVPSRLLCIDAKNFRRLVHDEPDLALAMLASCSKHLKYLVEQLEQIKRLSAPRRIANFLVGLCQSSTGTCTVTLPYEKSLIAKRLGMQPESFSRAMLKLRDIGVTMEREQVSISDVASLTDFAGRDSEGNQLELH